MTTPLSRARVALRAIHRFKAGTRPDVEEGDPEAAEAMEACRFFHFHGITSQAQRMHEQ